MFTLTFETAKSLLYLQDNLFPLAVLGLFIFTAGTWHNSLAISQLISCHKDRVPFQKFMTYI